MRSTRTKLAPLAIAGAFALSLAAATPSVAAPNDETELMARLATLNDSGTTGQAWGMLKGNDLMIKVTTTGALPDAPHAQHIHIGGTNTCPAPTMKGSGYQGAIRTTDAADSYGAVKVSLTAEPGKTDDSAALDVPNFPVGNAKYERTITLPAALAADVKAGKGVVVVHGVDHNGNGTYDGEQMSDLDPSLPSEATDPAACGEFEMAQMAMPDGGVQTGGDSTAGVQQAGVLGLGALATIGGALGLTAARRQRSSTRP